MYHYVACYQEGPGSRPTKRAKGHEVPTTKEKSLKASIFVRPKLNYNIKTSMKNQFLR
jgi:hypothetical protein